jgi:type II secretory pathway pseudopilin PulG
MKRAGILLAAALIVATAACGKSKEEKQAEEVQKEVQKQVQAAQKEAAATGASTEEGARQAAKGLEQFAKGLGGLVGGGAGGDSKPVPPVSFRDMQELFPNVDGWEKHKPTGERMSTPVSYSEAQVEYTKGDARIEMKMVDSGLNQLLLLPYTMFLTAGYEKETSDGYEKSAKVNGQPGWEKWDDSSKNGEVSALVNKRFVVTAEGHGIGDTKVLQEFLGKVDMEKVAALK